MKKFTVVLFLLVLWSGDCWAATRTSVGSGLASAAGTWDTGVPVDGDAFVVANTHDVEWDMDTSAWAGLAASTINAGGTLHASTSAGSYVIKMAGDLTNNGTLQVGTSTSVPYPSTCKFNITFTGAFSIKGTGVLYFYCTQPTSKYVVLDEGEPLGENHLSCDGYDVTGDIWAIGDRVAIIDSTPRDIQITTIANITATEIETVDNLDSAVSADSVLVLVERNIQVIGSTTWAISGLHTATDHWIAAELYCGAGINSSDYITFDGVLCNTASGDGIYGTYYLNATSNAYLVNGGIELNYTSTISCFIAGKNATESLKNVKTSAITNTVWIFGNAGMNALYDCIISGGKISNNSSGYGAIGPSYNVIASNLQMSGNTIGLKNISSAKFYNCLFGDTTEFDGYNSRLYRNVYSYVESFDHDQVENAYRAWCLGGIVSSQTSSPPSGYTIYYDHEVESALYPCFRQYQTTVLAGTAIEVSAVIRNTDGIDVSSTSPIDLRPRLEIIDIFADPLVDSTKSALDSDPIAVSNGTNTDWQAVDVIWANTGDSPRQVYVRIICYSHDASTHTIDEAWSVADYKDQIATIYAKLPTNYIMGSSVQTDKDDEIDAILVDTGTTIPALIAGITVDNGAIADEVVLHMDANSTDFNTLIAYAQEWDPNFTAILADTSELQADHANGGRLDVIWDAIKAVTDIMQAVNSTVQTPNDANNFVITNTGDINDVNDAYIGMTVYVKDATTGDWEARMIQTWETGREITVDYPFTFTPEAGDIVVIWGTSYFPIRVYDHVPLLPDTSMEIVDRTASGGGGTRTLDVVGDDP